MCSRLVPLLVEVSLYFIRSTFCCCFVTQEKEKQTLLAALKGGAKAALITPAQSTTGTGNAMKTGIVMSMSTALGNKAVPFGKTGGKKESKKSKKKKSRTKNYDDEGVGLPQ